MLVMYGKSDNSSDGLVMARVLDARSWCTDMVSVVCDALSKLGRLNRSRPAGSNRIGFVASDKLEGRLKNRFRRPLRMIAGLAYAP